MRKLHWWDDDDREVSLAPRHSRQAQQPKRERHHVNKLHEQAQEVMQAVEPVMPLVYA